MQIHPVANVVSYLREMLESDFLLGDLWVAGEVANLNRTSAGHLYFSLRDGNVALRCAFFASRNAGTALADGEAVLAHGRITLYEQRGDLQMVVDFVRPEGVGELAAQFELLKERLEAEGLFDPARKRPLPKFPHRIGVVTSPTGAVFHDITRVIARRWPLAEVVLAPTAVQGDQAAAQIVAALQDIQQENVDLVIAGRGGGSLEELWPFNEESVARAIYGCMVPVISAVGHETDYTIADFAADLRAPTPSAAAEMAVPDQTALRREIERARRGFQRAARTALASRTAALQAAEARLRRERPRPGETAARMEERVAAALRGLSRSLDRERERLLSCDHRLQALSPLATLERGYAIVQRADNRKVVSSVRQVKGGTGLQISVADGAFWAEVS